MPKLQETRRRAEIVKTEPRYSTAQKTKAGKRVHSGTRITDSDGVVKTLLTPAGKGAKYADELKNNRRITNDGQVKTNSCGCAQELTPEQKAWRGGYLAAQKDSAKCYNASQGKSGGKRK